MLSSRVRTGRSIRGFCLPPHCSRGERRAIEKLSVEGKARQGNYLDPLRKRRSLHFENGGSWQKLPASVLSLNTEPVLEKAGYITAASALQFVAESKSTCQREAGLHEVDLCQS